MTTVTFHQSDGEARTLTVEDGTTVMRAAVTAAVPGIVGECGGQAMCATCHVYVRDEHLGQLPGLTDDEEEMLDCTTAPRNLGRSRLGCQITLDATTDGFAVDVPESQV